MSRRTTEDSFAAGRKQGGPATPRDTPWWTLRRLFDPEHGDREVLVLTVPRGDDGASAPTHKVDLCGGDQSLAALLRLVGDAAAQDVRSLWRDPETEARFWTMWYRLMTGGHTEDPLSCNESIGILAKRVMGAPVYGDRLLRLCDTRFSEKNLEAMSRLEGALLRGEKDEIKIYGYVCLKLWAKYEEMFSEWLKYQFVLKALQRPCDPNFARVLRSHARFISTPGRLADLVAHLNRTSRSAVIETRYDKAFWMRNSLLPTAPSPSSATSGSAAREIFYSEDQPVARWWQSTLYRGVEARGDGTYKFVAVKVMSKVAPGPDQTSQRDAWFRDEYARKTLPRPANKTSVVFPNFGVFDMRPNRVISVSPWARHGNIKQYALRRVMERPLGDRRVHEIILDLMEQLLPAVEGVHKAGLVHGNLKGNNILITENAVVQLADFGSYDVSSAPYCATNRSSIPWHKRMVDKSGMFMSPELRRSGIPTKESDMWAVSCVFLEVYLYATQEGHVFEEADMGKPHPGIPGSILGLIRANWAVDPPLRRSAADMHQQLNQIRDVMQAGFSN